MKIASRSHIFFVLVLVPCRHWETPLCHVQMMSSVCGRRVCADDIICAHVTPGAVSKSSKLDKKDILVSENEVSDSSA